MSGAPVFRGGGVGPEEQALAEPIGNRFTREGFGCSGGEGGGGSLKPVGGPEARAGEGFETIGLCAVTAGFSEDGQVGLARFHQFGERTKAFLGHAEPVEISPGRIRRCFGFLPPLLLLAGGEGVLNRGEIGCHIFSHSSETAPLKLSFWRRSRTWRAGISPVPGRT